MDSTWIKHVAAALSTTIFCVSLSVVVGEVLGLTTPHGLDESVTIVGIFFASLIGTMVAIPELKQSKSQYASYFYKSDYGFVVISIIIAALCSVGGGISRGLIIGKETVLSKPYSSWWTVIFIGWSIGLFITSIKSDIYNNCKLCRSIFESIDAWIMGVFAVAGAMTVLGVNFIDGVGSKYILINLVYAGILGGITGAGGGLLAKIVAQSTYKQSDKISIGRIIIEWAFAQYTQIAFSVAVFSFIILLSIKVIAGLEIISVDAFRAASIKLTEKRIFDLLDYKAIETICGLLFKTLMGFYLIMYFISGFLACYMFRSRRN